MAGSKSFGTLGSKMMYKSLSAKTPIPVQFLIRENGICLDSTIKLWTKNRPARHILDRNSKSSSCLKKVDIRWTDIHDIGEYALFDANGVFTKTKDVLGFEDTIKNSYVYRLFHRSYIPWF